MSQYNSNSDLQAASHLNKRPKKHRNRQAGGRAMQTTLPNFNGKKDLKTIKPVNTLKKPDGQRTNYGMTQSNSFSITTKSNVSPFPRRAGATSIQQEINRSSVEAQARTSSIVIQNRAKHGSLTKAYES